MFPGGECGKYFHNIRKSIHRNAQDITSSQGRITAGTRCPWCLIVRKLPDIATIPGLRMSVAWRAMNPDATVSGEEPLP